MGESTDGRALIFRISTIRQWLRVMDSLSNYYHSRCLASCKHLEWKQLERLAIALSHRLMMLVLNI